MYARETMKCPCVYILASKPYGTLYVGVTSDLNDRMAQLDQSVIAAIAREKSLKRWRREWKYRLIGQMNPEWENLFNPETGEISFGSIDQESWMLER
jgi:putative endonuclease